MSIEFYNKPGCISMTYVDGPNISAHYAYNKNITLFSVDTSLGDALTITSGGNSTVVKYNEISQLQPTNHSTVFELCDLLTMWSAYSDSTDISQRDTFYRTRMVTPILIFESQFAIDKDAINFNELVVEGGAVEYDTDEVCVSISTSEYANSRALYQTKPYIKYCSGRSTMISFTCIMRTNLFISNNVCRVGVFDDINDKNEAADYRGNGVFFQVDGDGNLAIVLRSSFAGTQIDTVVDQLNWSNDTLNGCSGCGLNLDPTSINTYVIQIAADSGTIRCGVVYQSKVVYAHIFNNLDKDYQLLLQTFSLPFRAESINSADGGSAGQIKLHRLTATVDGTPDIIHPICADTGLTPINITSTSATSIPVLTVSNNGGIYCRININILKFCLILISGDILRYRVVLDATVATPSWQNDSNSVLKRIAYYDRASTTVSGGTTMYSGFITKSHNTVSIPVKNISLYASVDGLSGNKVTLVIDYMGSDSSITANCLYSESI